MSRNLPPKIAEYFLRKFTRDDDQFFILGDLEETFALLYEKRGRISASVWYWMQTGKLLPVYILHIFSGEISMLKNYFKVALRTLVKNKIPSAINIFGLSVGFALCLMIYLYVENEYSYDKFHEYTDDLYQARLEYTGRTMTAASGALGPALQKEIPEVVSYTRLTLRRFLVKKNNNVHREKVYFTDPSFFDNFSFRLVQGNPATALLEPNSAVLTEAIAEKYFGSTNPMNEVISIKQGEQFEDFIINGIIEDAPSNSSIQYDILINIEKLYGEKLSAWYGGFSDTFVRLTPGIETASLDTKLKSIITTYYVAADEDVKRAPQDYQIQLFPLKDYHFTDNGRFYSGVLESRSYKKYAYILSSIAFAILMIAAFNYVNLSIGRLTSRFKEIGVRKVLGAEKRQLIKQFWVESCMLSLFALLVGIALAILALPIFNGLSGKALSFATDNAPLTFSLLVFLTIMFGITVGSYPTLIFSKYNTVDIFKGKFRLGGSNNFTKSLIVVQFSLSITLVVSTLLMNHQLEFVANRKLGYNKENVLTITIERDKKAREESGLSSVFTTLKNELATYPDIVSIAGSNQTISDNYFTWSAKDHRGKEISMSLFSVDYTYFETLDIQLIEGRYFDRERPSDALGNAVIVNKTFAERFEGRQLLGMKIKSLVPEWSSADAEIIGVVNDFNFGSLHTKILPMAITASKEWFQYMVLKVNSADMSQTILALENAFKAIAPDQPFSYAFLDDTVERQYASDRRWENIINISSLLAVFVAMSGLFGLTVLTLSRRIKELGIRKVLGASALKILNLVNKEFLKLILLANLLAWPIAYYIMRLWLDTFAYRIEITYSTFVLALISITLVAVTTISAISLKTALQNPSVALRDE